MKTIAAGLLFSLLSGLLNLQAEPEAANEGSGRVIALAAKVAPHGSPDLSPEELEEFGRLVQMLNYDQTLEAMDALELPEGEAITARTIKPGEPIVRPVESWEHPARILAQRLLVMAPKHTYRWVQREELGWRGGGAYMKLFPTEMPRVAWDETKRVYGVFLDRFWGEHPYAPPPFANEVFFAIEGLEGNLGRELLLDGSYAGEPFETKLQRDALMGMLRACGSEEEYVSFLDWRIGEAAELPDERASHGFTVVTGPSNTITSSAN